MNTRGTLLVIGATGSIGRHVVETALIAGWTVRALVRDVARASFSAPVEVVPGDLTDAATLANAVDGIDAVVLTHGTHGSEAGFRDVDYGAVRNVLSAIGARRVRIALMTSIGLTHTDDSYNRATHIMDWKRRGERLVRASGKEYTIVRPGWFDYNGPDENRLAFRQGDAVHSGGPSDGVIARSDIARVLVESLTDAAAIGTTLELVAEHGPAQDDLSPLFAALEKDEGVDGRRDASTLPIEAEPEDVRNDLVYVASHS